ncbi:MAG: hypothetical protein HQK55_10510, partial [Deltaproteobacteria bacterium]|nr:hypothetical protein [Deltaproteobacteria bacterium]
MREIFNDHGLQKLQSKIDKYCLTHLPVLPRDYRQGFRQFESNLDHLYNTVLYHSNEIKKLASASGADILKRLKHQNALRLAVDRLMKDGADAYRTEANDPNLG